MLVEAASPSLGSGTDTRNAPIGCIATVKPYRSRRRSLGPIGLPAEGEITVISFPKRCPLTVVRVSAALEVAVQPQTTYLRLA